MNPTAQTIPAHPCNKPGCRTVLKATLCPEHLAELPSRLRERIRRVDNGVSYLEFHDTREAVQNYWMTMRNENDL